LFLVGERFTGRCSPRDGRPHTAPMADASRAQMGTGGARKSQTKGGTEN
jgi:hypothetical protein